MDYKETMISDCQKTVKIKASHAQIVVGGQAENPVYSILYFDTDKCDWYIGWSSRNIGHVQTWLKEEFEPGYKRISDFITDLLARAEAAEARCKRLDEARERANEACAKWKGKFRMAEARVRELETTYRIEKCDSGPECVELGKARKALADAEAKAEKAEMCIVEIENAIKFQRYSAAMLWISEYRSQREE